MKRLLSALKKKFERKLCGVIYSLYFNSLFIDLEN